MRKILLILSLLMLIVIPASAQEPRPCLLDHEEEICWVANHGWTPEALAARSAQEDAPVWADGNRLTFAIQSEVTGVQLCCGLQVTLRQVEDSDWLTYTVEIPRLDEAVISYGFWTYHEGEYQQDQPGVWRGTNAPAPAPIADPLAGTLESHEFESAALGESRTVMVYLPPGHTSDQRYPVVYAADGDATPDLAAHLEPLIVDGTLPPTIIVGAYSGISTPQRDLRSEEYLPTYASDRFAPHETFFTVELREWAEDTFGASTDADQRAVFGYSNGGVFAAAMGIHHPDIYGYALAFSLGVSPGDLPERGTEMAQFYFVTGTLENAFNGMTSYIEGSLDTIGATTEFHDWVAGHDYIMWVEMFPQAVTWAFGE